MTTEKPSIDFQFFAALSRDTGACIEIEENGRIYRFRPLLASLAPVGQPNTEAPAAPLKPMTPAALAKRWLCSERHVRNMINTGELRCFRLGGKLIRVLPEDIIRFEASEDYQMGATIIDEPASEKKPKRKTASPKLEPSPEISTSNILRKLELKRVKNTYRGS